MSEGIDSEVSTTGWDKNLYIELENAEAGLYYIYMKIDWNQKTEALIPDLDFALGVYGPA
jgi:hypothetical protein